MTGRPDKLAILLMQDRFLFRPAGGRIEENTQKFRADENSVIELPNVQSIEDYFEVQNRIWYSVPRAGEIRTSCSTSRNSHPSPTSQLSPLSSSSRRSAAQRVKSRPDLKLCTD